MLWVGIPKEFQVLLAINLEFLGISRVLEPELLQLGISRNSQSEFTMKIHIFYS